MGGKPYGRQHSCPAHSKPYGRLRTTARPRLSMNSAAPPPPSPPALSMHSLHPSPSRHSAAALTPPPLMHSAAHAPSPNTYLRLRPLLPRRVALLLPRYSHNSHLPVLDPAAR